MARTKEFLKGCSCVDTRCDDEDMQALIDSANQDDDNELMDDYTPGVVGRIATHPAYDPAYDASSSSNQATPRPESSTDDCTKSNTDRPSKSRARLKSLSVRISKFFSLIFVLFKSDGDRKNGDRKNGESSDSRENASHEAKRDGDDDKRDGDDAADASQPISNQGPEMWTKPAGIDAVTPGTLRYPCHDVLIVHHPDDLFIARAYKDDLLSRNIEVYNRLIADRPLQVLLLGDILIADMFDQIAHGSAICTSVFLFVTRNFFATNFFHHVTKTLLSRRLHDRKRVNIVPVYMEFDLYGKLESLCSQRGLSYYDSDTTKQRSIHYKQVANIFSKYCDESSEIRAMNEFRLQRARSDWVMEQLGTNPAQSSSAAVNASLTQPGRSNVTRLSYRGSCNADIPRLPPPPNHSSMKKVSVAS